MGELLPLSFLIGHNHSLTGIDLQGHAATLTKQKVIGRDLISVNHRQCQPISPRAELLHQVKRERGAARPQRMQEPNLWIKPRLASQSLMGSALGLGIDWTMRSSVPASAQSVSRCLPSGTANFNLTIFS